MAMPPIPCAKTMLHPKTITGKRMVRDFNSIGPNIIREDKCIIINKHINVPTNLRIWTILQIVFSPVIVALLRHTVVLLTVHMQEKIAAWKKETTAEIDLR